MSDQNVTSKVAEVLKTLGNIIESTALLKTSASKNITISDWNELMLKVSTLRPDIETLCQLLSDIAPDIDAKVSKVTDANVLYGTSSTGAPYNYGVGLKSFNHIVDSAEDFGKVVLRDIIANVPLPMHYGTTEYGPYDNYSDNSAIPKQYAQDRFVSKTSLKMRLYGTNATAKDTVYLLDKNPSANSVVQRDANSDIRVSEVPVADNGAVSKKYVDSAIKALQDAIDAINVFFESEDIDGAVDNLKEIQAFLESGGESVTDLYEQLNNKVDETDVSVFAMPSKIVMRATDGNIVLPMTDNSGNQLNDVPQNCAVPQFLLAKQLANKVDKSTIPYCAYGTGGGGISTMYPVGPAASQGVIPMRTTSGQIIAPNQETYEPDIDQFVSKRYTDNLVNPLVKRVEQLESATLTHILDSTPAYDKLVPVNSGKYSYLKRLGGASYRARSSGNILVSTELDGFPNGAASVDADGNVTSYESVSGDHCYLWTGELPVGTYDYEVVMSQGDFYGCHLGQVDEYEQFSSTTKLSGTKGEFTVTDGQRFAVEFEGKAEDSDEMPPAYTTFKIALFEKKILASAKVSKIESLGVGLIESIDTIEIPEAIKDTKGYGLGINEEYYNFIDLPIGKQTNRVGQKMFDGTETITKVGSASMVSNFFVTISDAKYLDGIPCKCNLLEGKISGGASSHGVGSAWFQSTSDYPRFYMHFPTDITTVEQAKTYLKSQYDKDNPLTVNYVLAEETETDITVKDEIIVEAGGTIRLIGEDDLPLSVPVPNTMYFVTRKE